MLLKNTPLLRVATWGVCAPRLAVCLTRGSPGWELCRVGHPRARDSHWNHCEDRAGFLRTLSNAFCRRSAVFWLLQIAVGNLVKLYIHSYPPSNSVVGLVRKSGPRMDWQVTLMSQQVGSWGQWPFLHQPSSAHSPPKALQGERLRLLGDCSDKDQTLVLSELKCSQGQAETLWQLQRGTRVRSEWPSYWSLVSARVMWA